MSTSALRETNNQRSETLPRGGNNVQTGTSMPALRGLRGMVQTGSTGRPLRLLSFDGGGIRGLSSLYILKEIMKRVELRTGDTDIPLPCDYFDMICGTSTGGIIAIMLGKLWMSVDQAIDSYVRLSETIFGEKKGFWFLKEGMYSTQALEYAITLIVGERAHVLGWPEAAGANPQPTEQEYQEIGRKVMMRGVNPTANDCKVFVCAVNTMNADAPANIRAYMVTQNEMDDFAIWEAARATSAAPHFFKPMVLEPRSDINRHLEMVYIDGGLQFNNPIHQLLDEASRQFPGRGIGLILSLGTGTKNAIKLPRAGFIPKPQWYLVFQLYKKIALSCEENHQAVTRRFKSWSNIYYRFNVDRGMGDIGLEEWKMLSQIETNTKTYTETIDVNASIELAVESFFTTNARMTIQQAAGLAK
ncbi:acyl transferase/acyl hydrolase/lysophospholipase [Rhizoctonia solani]|nr:acyl transferase/acyl hydrolase/lysophospholipase [Rhizoctonia solani]